MAQVLPFSPLLFLIHTFLPNFSHYLEHSLPLLFVIFSGLNSPWPWNHWFVDLNIIFPRNFYTCVVYYLENKYLTRQFTEGTQCYWPNGLLSKIVLFLLRVWQINLCPFQYLTVKSVGIRSTFLVLLTVVSCKCFSLVILVSITRFWNSILLFLQETITL